jgi:hypothetical protein
MTRHFDAEEQIVSGSQDVLPDAPKPGGATLTASGTQTVLMLASGVLFVNGAPLPDAENIALKLEGEHVTVCFKLRVLA